MHCDQIRIYLADYVAGALPGFKTSWVVQHLAGCDDCRGLMEEARRTRAGSHGPSAERAPVAATAEPLFEAGGPASVAVQRPVPPGVRRVLSALVLVLLLGAPWLVLRGVGSAEPPAAPSPTARPLLFQSAMQSQAGVSLRLESLVANQDELRATFRFHGSDISPPGALDSWVTVYGAGGERLPSWLPVVATDAGGVTAQVAFPLPDDQAGFRVTFTGVNQNTTPRWELQLPTPPDRLEQFNGKLPGAPGGVALQRYGMVSDLLQVELVVAETLAGGIPSRLFLRDGGGMQFAPSAYEGPGTNGEIMLQFPVPKNLRLPIRLVGDGHMRNDTGPWTIEVNVLK